MIAEESKRAKIAEAMEAKIKRTESPAGLRKFKERLSELFSQSQSAAPAPAFQTFFSRLLKEAEDSPSLLIDRESLARNYRYIILNLAAKERDSRKLSDMLGLILGEVRSCIDEGQADYVKSIFNLIQKNTLEQAWPQEVMVGFADKLSNLIENAIVEKDFPDKEAMADLLSGSTVDAGYYLQKIFSENKLSVVVLRLFFSFFPNEAELFSRKLQERASDLDFVTKMISVLSRVDSPLAVSAMKQVYFHSNNLIKLEVIKAFNSVRIMDKVFLLSVLENDDVMLRKQSLISLSREEDTLREALKKMLELPNYFGINNGLLRENISLIEELGIRQAKDKLVYLSRKFGFFNSDVRKTANEVLMRWGNEERGRNN